MCRRSTSVSPKLGAQFPATAGNQACHVTVTLQEACVEALQQHTGIVKTALRFTRVPYDAASTSAAARSPASIAPPCSPASARRPRCRRGGCVCALVVRAAGLDEQLPRSMHES
jgi:hypothetical protein